MSREKDGFRANLERIDKAYPKKELLTVTEIAKFEGCDRGAVKKRYKWNAHGMITKSDWARQVSV